MTNHQRNAKQQQKSNEALQRRKAMRRLKKQADVAVQKASIAPGTQDVDTAVEKQPAAIITAEMVHESMLVSAIDRMASSLERRYIPNPHPLAIESQSTASPWAYMPYVPLKRTVNWLSPRQQDRNSIVSLHDEILAFAKYVSLTAIEESRRQCMKEDIMDAIASKFPLSTVRVFGSHEIGLSVFFSDVDVSILGLSIGGEDSDESLGNSSNPIDLIESSSELSNATSPSSFKEDKLAVYDSQYFQPAVRELANASSVRDNDRNTVNNSSKKRKIDNEDSSNMAVLASRRSIVDNQMPIDARLPIGDDIEPEEDSLITWTIDCKGDTDQSKQGPSNPISNPSYCVNSLQQDSILDGGKCESAVESDFKTKSDDELGSDGSQASNSDQASYSLAVNGMESDANDSEFLALSNEDNDDSDDDDSESTGSSYEDGDDYAGDSSSSSSGEESDNEYSRQSEPSDTGDYHNSINLLGMNGRVDNNHRQQEVYYIDDSDSSDDDGNDDNVDEDAEKSESLPRKRRALSEDIDLNLTTNPSSNRSMTTGGLSPQSAAKRKLKLVTLLGDVFAHLRSLAWVKEGELRKKARVPIINVMHHCGIPMDISIGVAAQDTSEKIKLLYSIYPEAFTPLAAFLKVFLYLNDLDKVFSGGIGSYKLYVMIAFILSKLSPTSMSPGNASSGSIEPSPQTKLPDLGFILLAFFKYFGNPTQFNTGTILQVHGVDALFDKTFKLEQCRMLFHKAYQVLYRRMQDVIAGILIDSEKLKTCRDYYQMSCAKYQVPIKREQIAIANAIIIAIRNKQQEKFPVRNISIEDVQRLRPSIANRLLCYRSVESAMTRNGSSSHSGHHSSHNHGALHDISSFNAKHNRKPKYHGIEYDGRATPASYSGKNKKRKREDLQSRHSFGGKMAKSGKNWPQQRHQHAPNMHKSHHQYNQYNNRRQTL